MAQGKKSFKEQIKSPKWQKKRLEILERDEFSCQNCGETEEQLHVHHLLYHKDTMFWDYDNKYLITFCDVCHYNWHKANNEIKELLCIDSERLLGVLEIIKLIYNKDPEELMWIKKMIDERT